MAVYLVTSPLGPILLDDKGGVVDHLRWRDDAEEVADKIVQLEEGKMPEELTELIKRNAEKIDRLVVEDEDVGRGLSLAFAGLRVEVRAGNSAAKLFRSSIARYLDVLGVSPEEYGALLRGVSIALTRRKVKKAAEKRDLFVAQAVNALDDINKTINLFASRAREWYGLHFPELNDLVEDHEDYVKMVSSIGSRNNITKKKLVEIGIGESLAEKIAEAAGRSMGADVADFDLEAIRRITDTTLKLYEARRSLERYIDEAMLEVAPNVRGLVGPLLGARLIALAGGLPKLAALPASTIQVLGAEKALFRALRTGTRPPKHGVIFQYPSIHRAPRWQRGKIARALAAKLAIAARIDAFTGEYKADELRAELERRIEEIKEMYPKPPTRKREKGARPGRRYRKRRR